MANPSLDHASAEQAMADRPRAQPAAGPVLSASGSAVDHTLGPPEARQLVSGLFWFLVLCPAVLAGIFVHPLVGLALAPLQILAAILIGTAVARWPRCGPVTFASMPLAAAAMAWAANTLLF